MDEEEQDGVAALGCRGRHVPLDAPTVTAYAVTLKKASQLAFADSELYSNGRLCAIASGIVSVASSSFEIDGMAGNAEKFAPPGL